MGGHILALDQGTTSSRAIIFNDAGHAISMVQQPTQLLTPKSGYVEQDANQIWQTQLSCVNDVIHKAGLLSTDIDCFAITNQRETTVVWDKSTGQPIAPAIIWQDRRTTQWCEQQKQQDADMQTRIQHKTGLRLDPYFSASKIRWLLQHNPQVRQLAKTNRLAVGTVDSWLIYKLTGGEHFIDVSNASRTLLFDINKMQWSDELLRQFEIPKSILPKVLASDADFGKTKKGLFSKQIPIQAVLGDQQAALFGQGCHSPGMAKNTYGTGCFMLMNIGDTPQLSQHQLLTTVAWQSVKPLSHLKHQQELPESSVFDKTLLNPHMSNVTDQDINTANNPEMSQHAIGKWMQSGKRMLQSQLRLSRPTYALEGSVFMAGAIVQWLRDNLGLFTSSNDVEQLAKSVKQTDGVVLVPAFTGLGAPYWQPDATASLSGMTRGTTKAHIARAALEAIAFQTYDVLIAMQKDSPYPLSELRVDGGGARNDLLMQFQADLLGVPVLRPKDTEVTAKGAALLAGLRSGLYDKSIIETAWQLDRAFEPKISEDERHVHLQRWQHAIKKYVD